MSVKATPLFGCALASSAGGLKSTWSSLLELSPSGRAPASTLSDRGGVRLDGLEGEESLAFTSPGNGNSSGAAGGALEGEPAEEDCPEVEEGDCPEGAAGVESCDLLGADPAGAEEFCAHSPALEPSSKTRIQRQPRIWLFYRSVTVSVAGYVPCAARKPCRQRRAVSISGKRLPSCSTR